MIALGGVAHAPCPDPNALGDCCLLHLSAGHHSTIRPPHQHLEDAALLLQVVRVVATKKCDHRSPVVVLQVDQGVIQPGLEALYVTFDCLQHSSKTSSSLSML